MFPQLRPDESAIAGIHRIFLAHIGTALDALSKKGALSDTSVHDARKAIKRARATLRLMRPAIGDKFYKQENILLRDAARPLTQVRDAKILVDALDALLTHSDKAAASAAGKLRDLLQAQQLRSRKSMFSGTARLNAIRASLRGAQKRVQRWPFLEDDWDALGPALARVYKAGRNALAEAQSNPTDEALHEWRKQTKYLWHELQILQPLRPGLIGELAEEAHRLADVLGDDHDLAVLRAKILGSRAAFDAQSRMNTLAGLLDRRRAELQDQAFEAGQRLYRKKPAAFLERLEKAWHRWRNGQADR